MDAKRRRVLALKAHLWVTEYGIGIGGPKRYTDHLLTERVAYRAALAGAGMAYREILAISEAGLQAGFDAKREGKRL